MGMPLAIGATEYENGLESSFSRVITLGGRGCHAEESVAPTCLQQPSSDEVSGAKGIDCALPRFFTPMESG